ncbi:MAG: 3-phosphoshikimate 1-carboxyvinyltransferase [Flavobacteriaceae bacterium]|nr:3-phosphoshikimate 1-carboxyvinyltransferase [Flavobacteriaceae bacterium]
MHLSKLQLLPNQCIQISGSKSESNRLLILQKLWGDFEVKNLSNSQDTQLLKKALESKDETIDIHHAGTAMRFLTSYFAIQEGKTTILTGSKRMKERPIHHLVSALRSLGADIQYLENEGFPPLKINGKKLTKNFVKIPANISSQFISSLILIGSQLENGLTIQLEGEITSRPYLEMTLKQLSELRGIHLKCNSEQMICIPPLSKTENQTPKITFVVESDWSSASYFYSMVAIGRENIYLKHFKENSLQGDAILVDIYRGFFGVETIFNDNESIELHPKQQFEFPKRIELNMKHCPDLAQTICITASALNIHFKINGLSTLKIKETDRLLALHNELLKIGVETKITENSIESITFSKPQSSISIATYNDHRMAMSLAPYALVAPLEIQNPEVVEKSYPNFWRDFKAITLA